MLKTIILITAIIIMAIGVMIDVKQKKFPNFLILVLIMLGVWYYILLKGFNTLYIPLGLFIIFNLCGIFFHKIKLVAPGDMKFFSIMPFYFDWTGETSIAFIICLIVVSVINLGYLIYKREHSFMAILNSLKQQLFELKVFCISKTRLSPTYAEIDKNEGIAFTLPLFITFLIILILKLNRILE